MGRDAIVSGGICVGKPCWDPELYISRGVPGGPPAVYGEGRGVPGGPPTIYVECRGVPVGHLQYMLNVGACPVGHLQTEGVAPAAFANLSFHIVWKPVQLAMYRTLEDC